MNWSNVKWIYLREIRDQMRDRRTLFTIFVLPVLLYPLLGMGLLQIAEFSREHQTPVLVVGVESLPLEPRLIVDESFAEEFCPAKEKRLLRLEIAKPGEWSNAEQLRQRADGWIQSGKYDAVVYFPPDFSLRLAKFRKDAPQALPDAKPAAKIDEPMPRIFVNTANDKSRMAQDRVEDVLYRWRDKLVSENLRQQNVPADVIEPFQLVNTDVALEGTRRAAVWSKILPFVVLVWALTGAFYPAIDLCAGEKERGTLETLLCSPAQRIEIVWGKLLTIMTFSIATSLLNLASLGCTGTFVIMQMERLGGLATRTAIGAPPLSAVLWLVVALVPLSALFSALSLAVAAFARSSREGNYYLIPLFFVTLPLMMLSLMPTTELDLGTSLIPITGVMLLLRSVIEGNHWESLRFALPVIAITSVCCWLAIRWAVRQFNNESVLFRESERWGVGVWIRHLVRDRGETPSLAEALFCGVLLLLLMRFFVPLFLRVPHDWSGWAVTTVVTLLAFVATPALIMSVMLTRSPRQTLLLRLPSPVGLVLASLLAVAIHPAAMTVAQVVNSLYPMSPAIEQHVQGLKHVFEEAPNMGVILLVLAVVPALCEEVAFRGFILSGMMRSGSNWAAIIGSAIFFGATHAIVQQSLMACVLGVVIGYIAVRTRSLLPGAAFHCIYNSMSLLLGIALSGAAARSGIGKWIWETGGEDVAEGIVAYRWPVVLLSFVLSGLILWTLRRLPNGGTASSSLDGTRQFVPAGSHPAQTSAPTSIAH